MRLKLFSLLSILALICMYTGCSESNPSLELYLTSDLGTLLALSPEDVTSLRVTLNAFEVHRYSGGEDSGWVQLQTPNGSIDLMNIADVEQLVSSSDIQEGQYNQMKFYIASAQVTTASGTYTAEVPSEKISVSFQFTVEKGQTAEVVLEFEPRASLNISGNENNPKFKIQPVIHVKGVRVTGD